MGDNVHAGHRDRLKAQFLQNGLQSFTPYQMLELMLFYAIPRQDTNPLAHRLLDAFGSLAGVFNASYEDLCRVPGISGNTATLILLCRQMFQEYYKGLFQPHQRLTSTQTAAEFIVPRFVGAQQERVFLVCLDGRCGVLYADFVSEGDGISVSIPVRTVFALAMRYNASAVLLAHNHPNHYAVPSEQDVEATARIGQMLQEVGVRILDHLIIPGIATAPEDMDLSQPRLEYVSMRETPKFEYLFRSGNAHVSRLSGGDGEAWGSL